jgi:hypothetical protein
VVNFSKLFHVKNISQSLLSIFNGQRNFSRKNIQNWTRKFLTFLLLILSLLVDQSEVIHFLHLFYLFCKRVILKEKSFIHF